MSRTVITQADNINPKLVEERLLFIDTIKESFFGRFMSSDGSSIVHERTDFTKKRGDTMYFPMRYRLTGDGVTGNQTMKGKEQKLETASFSVTLERYRNAILDDGALTRQRSPFPLPEEMRRALIDWGVERIDKLLMDALMASPTTALYGGDAVSTATLEATDLLTPALLSKAKVQALTQRSSKAIPLNPIMIGGRRHLVLLASPDAVYDFKRNSEYQESVKDAMVRGTENPLFKGMIETADAIWDGVLIYSHENVPITANAGAVNYTQCALMGTQALVWAWGERASIVEESEDYDEFKGYCWRMTGKGAKPVFTNKDFGSVALYVADSRSTGRTSVAK